MLLNRGLDRRIRALPPPLSGRRRPSWRAFDPMQRDRVIRNPGTFLPVGDQDTGEQLDFMAKKLEGYSAWEKSGVHEYASAERNCERHGFRLGKRQGGIR